MLYKYTPAHARELVIAKVYVLAEKFSLSLHAVNSWLKLLRISAILRATSSSDVEFSYLFETPVEDPRVFSLQHRQNNNLVYAFD